MESIGEGLSHVHFVSASYAVAAILIVGMAFWIIKQRQSIQALQRAVKHQTRRNRS